MIVRTVEVIKDIMVVVGNGMVVVKYRIFLYTDWTQFRTVSNTPTSWT